MATLADMSILRSKQNWRRPRKPLPQGAKPREYPNRLSPGEQENVRRALAALRRRHAPEDLAAALRLSRSAYEKAGGRSRPISRKLAYKIARVAGMGVELLLSTGLWERPCPHCFGTGWITHPV